MNTLTRLQSELEQEYQTTKNFIDLFPKEKNDYAPHPKSMKMMPLAGHIVEIFEWPSTILATAEIDFGKGDYKPTILSRREDLLKKLEDCYTSSKSALEKAKEEDLNLKWTMKNNGVVLVEFTKYAAIRHSLNQIIHHRAQLGVYYRLNNIQLPASYGPSADSQNF